MTEPQLPFTGERFTPECVREMAYEHWHRYAFAARLAAGRRVLDAACGEGYGSALLARAGAAAVTGVDVSAEAIAHARERYGQLPGTGFVQEDCTRLESLPEAGFDLIVSFETLEHVHEQERMLDRFARLLAPGGVLLVSSPDRHAYSEVRGYRNEFHVRELYRAELEALLHSRFAAVRLYGQKLVFQSVLWALAPGGGWEAATLGADGTLAPQLRLAPLYFIAACAHASDALDGLPSLHLFGDEAESVYAHYDQEVRRNIAAGHRIAELEQEIERLQAQLPGTGARGPR